MNRILALILLLKGIPLLMAADARLKFAISDFETDEFVHQTHLAARDHSDTVQPLVVALSEHEFVERAELDRAKSELALSSHGFVQDHAPLRVGQWVAADVLIRGQFTRQDRQRVLHLEAIDLSRANVLVERQIPLPKDRGTSLLDALPAPTETAKQVNSLVAAAAEAHRENAQRKHLALLYFILANPADGYDPIAERFRQELDQRMAQEPSIKLLRLPRASSSADESILISSGLAIAKASSWKSIADLYVWGSFTGSGRIVDGSYPAGRFELTIWRGSGQPIILSLQCKTFADRPRLLNRLMDEIMAEAKSGAPADDSRDEIQLRRELSKAALAGSAQILKNIPNYKRTTGSPDHLALVRTLDAALYLDPLNQLAREEFLRNLWGHQNSAQAAKNPVLAQNALAVGWRDYVKHFGVAGVPQILPRKKGMFRHPNSVAYNYFKSAQRYSGALPSGIPYDQRQAAGLKALEFRIEAALATMSDPKVRREYPMTFESCLRFNYPADLISKKMINKELHERFIQTMWQIHVDHFNKTGETIIRSETAGRITGFYEAVGEPEKASALFRMLKPPKRTETVRPAPPTKSPPRPRQSVAKQERKPKPLPDSVFQVPQPSFGSPVLPVVQRHLVLPRTRSYIRVHKIVTADDQVYLLATIEEKHQPPSEGTAQNRQIKAKYVKATHVWRCPLTGGDWSRVFRGDHADSLISDFAVDDKFLWIALQRSGLVRLDLANREEERWNKETGLLNDSLVGIIDHGDHLLIVPKRSQVQRLTKENLAFETLPAAATIRDQPRSPERRLSAMGGNTLLTSAYEHHLYRPQSNAWISATPAFQAMAAGHSQFVVQGVSAGADGDFWVASSHGLHHLDSDTLAVRTWHPPKSLNLTRSTEPGQALSLFADITIHRQSLERIEQSTNRRGYGLRPNSRLTKPVDCTLPDGDFMWLTTTDHFLHCWNHKSDQWVGRIRLPNRATALQRVGQQIWIGFEGFKALVTVDRKAFLDRPRDQWVTGEISDEEMEAKLDAMPALQRARYHFLDGDYPAAVQILQPLSADAPGPETLLLLGYCHDARGMQQTDLARRHFLRIITEYPNTYWSQEAHVQLEYLRHRVAQLNP